MHVFRSWWKWLTILAFYWVFSNYHVYSGNTVNCLFWDNRNVTLRNLNLFLLTDCDWCRVLACHIHGLFLAREMGVIVHRFISGFNLSNQPSSRMCSNWRTSITHYWKCYVNSLNYILKPTEETFINIHCLSINYILCVFLLKEQL